MHSIGHMITQNLIDNVWVNAADGAVFSVYNPANGTEIARVPNSGSIDAERAITAAQRAFETWCKTTGHERSKLLRKWYELIRKHTDELSDLIALEMGKPRAEALGEVIYGSRFVEWFSEEAKRGYGDVIPPPHANQRLLTIRQPIGVVAAITPWNFPMAMITRKIAPALAAGCTVVVKPAEDTPLTALLLARLALEAGFPAGVVNVVVTHKPDEVGQLLTSDSRVRKISFTGSTQVGVKLMAQSAPTVKKVSLELGGNAPFIVFDDAHIAEAVDGAINAKYRNTGQTCICANRIYVQRGIYDEFSRAFTKAMSSLEVGPSSNPNAQIGPLINQRAIEKVEQLVEDAVIKGARVLIGGVRHSEGELFYTPTVLSDVTDDMACATTEIFGPVAPLYVFDTEEEVIARANDTPYGLAAYFYARDYARIWRVSEQLEAGMVGVNETAISNEAAPFGGIKSSGIGREGSKYGMEEFTEIKLIAMRVNPKE